MNDDLTGGSAFPVPAFCPSPGPDGLYDHNVIADYATLPEVGMTILDHFAGCALTGYLSAHADSGVVMPSPAKAASRSYAYAAAMIAERRRLYDEPPLCQCPGSDQVGEVPPIPPPEVPPMPPHPPFDLEYPDLPPPG